MSSDTLVIGSGQTSFPFDNSNENNQWPVLSVIGVVVTVLGFIGVVWFIFWVFKREQKLRSSSDRDASTLEALDH